jgi:SAM-dependent methyltransferase
MNLNAPFSGPAFRGDDRPLRRVKDFVVSSFGRLESMVARRGYPDLDLSPFSQVCIGDFSVRGRFWNALSRFKAPADVKRVLVIGCGEGYGSDINIWIRHGVKEIHACDLVSYDHWDQLARKYKEQAGVSISFFQADAVDLKRDSETFDIVYSEAVFEHVQDLEVAIRETMRVLKKGGVSSHQIGPLYFTHGGDHCISAYGLDSGYDHLLLSRDEYRRKINDDAFFAS